MLTAYVMWIMQTYLTEVWKLGFTHAAGIVNIADGLAKVLPLVFFIIVDSGLGNRWMLLLSSISYVIVSSAVSNSSFDFKWRKFMLLELNSLYLILWDWNKYYTCPIFNVNCLWYMYCTSDSTNICWGCKKWITIESTKIHVKYQLERSGICQDEDFLFV